MLRLRSSWWTPQLLVLVERCPCPQVGNENKRWMKGRHAQFVTTDLGRGGKGRLLAWSGASTCMQVGKGFD